MKLYRKKSTQPMEAYTEGMDISAVSVSPEDTPEPGGMIAHNPDNPADRWYVARQYFLDNYEEV